MGKMDYIENSFPFDLEDKIGVIIKAEEQAPGTYYITAHQEGTLAQKYYVVLDNGELSEKVQKYGEKLGGLRLYPVNDDASGWRIVEYELCKRMIRSDSQSVSKDALRDIALHAAEYHPEYFGEYPVPFHTPHGLTLRHRTLENGIYWLETDRCEEILAVCYPIWNAELSSAVQFLGEQLEYDLRGGIHSTMGYLFFSPPAACAAIYELIETRPKWDGTLINKAALMNVIWKELPSYAILSNWWEQKGLQAVRLLLKELCGIEMEPQLDPQHIVTIFPDAGEKYLLLD